MTPLLPNTPQTPNNALISLGAVTWKSGTHYTIPSGKIAFSNGGLAPIPSDVVIEGVVDTSGRPITFLDFTAQQTYQHLFNIPRSSARVTIRNLSLTVNQIQAIYSEGSDVTLEKIYIQNGVLAAFRNSNRTHITKCMAPVLPAYMCFWDWAGDGNFDVTMDNCSCDGSIHEHDLRMYGVHRALIQDCKLFNPPSAPWAVKKGECVKVCSGSDIVFRGVAFDGNLQPGPNYQLHTSGSGGKYDGKLYAPNAPITPLVKGLTFENCTNVSGNIRLMPGVSGLMWHGGSLNLDTSAIFSVQSNTKPATGVPGGFPDRPVVSGELADLKCFSHGTGVPSLFAGTPPWRGGMKVKDGVFLNSHAVPQAG